MTNHWEDIKNSDCILIMGSNAAENHPISFKWVKRAQAQGATVIHVDPRYTRTSENSDIYAPLRSGTDIAFLGGMIRYILENKKYFAEYVKQNTNATFLLKEDYKFDAEKGLFSGFNTKTKKYDHKSWAFEMDENGVPKRDFTLENPRSVFQILKTHYSRYTIENVEAITGTPKDKILAVYDAFSATGVANKSGTSMYALGWTQHTVGVQNIRCMAIVQLLLGNIGVPGGGVNALRGESNVQGATDHAILYHILPGYLATPRASLQTLKEYNLKHTPVSKDPKSANWWSNFPKYSASLLRSMYPEPDLETAYSWLPKLDEDQNDSFLHIFDKMFKGQYKGFFAWGQNPACCLANSTKNRQALAKLEWMVHVNIFDTETASFWRGPEMKTKQIKTEVFFVPCAVSVEKEGSITNSGRWLQWRYAGAAPQGDSKPDGDIMFEIMQKVQELYKNDKKAVFPKPVLGFGLNQLSKDGVFNSHSAAKLINGYFVKDVTIKDKIYKAGQQVPNFTMLQDDGSTCSGNWLYCGSYTDDGNMGARRDKSRTDKQASLELHPNWAWAWPLNRRVLYNRAAVDEKGNPWASNKATISWDTTTSKWVGDVPDGGYKPGDKLPFIMLPDGVASLFGPGRVDGPFPEHYEPIESPVKSHPFSKQMNNPMAITFSSAMEKLNGVDNKKHPYICTTYRVTEHWQTGVLTRNTPWLLETMPQLFVEISHELAKELDIKNGESVIVENSRGSVTAVAMVTARIKPYKIQGEIKHLVGVPFHYGWLYPKNGGDNINLLSPSVGDPNTAIPETKAFMVNLRKVGGKKS